MGLKRMVSSGDKMYVTGMLVSFIVNWFACLHLQVNCQQKVESLTDKFSVILADCIIAHCVCLQLKGEDIAIVKMDATSNDVSGPYEVRGFPTIYWAPKDSKDSPVRYEVSGSHYVHVLS